MLCSDTQLQHAGLHHMTPYDMHSIHMELHVSEQAALIMISAVGMI